MKKMATSKNYLAGFESEPTTIKAAGLYLGASVSEYEGVYSHQFALIPSQRDPKGGVVVLKANKALELRENVVYMIEASSNSDRPSRNYGVTAYYLHTPKKLIPVARFEERELANG